ncbi:MAG: helix-turn-helix transcriptional regulator [Pseudomonadota bacterium]
MTIRVRREAIKALRQERSWTQEQLAEEARLAARTVQRAETEGVVSLRTFKALAAALGVETHTLEYRTDRIDFGPVLMEMKILMLAITRRLMPLDDRDLPNSLVALFAVLAFSARYTLINAIVLIAGQPDAQLADHRSLIVFGLALGFSAFFAGVVYPVFKLRSWARRAMLAICCFFLAVNLLLPGGELMPGGDPIQIAAAAKYLLNLAVTFWMVQVLTRADVARLYEPARVAAS